MPNEIEKDYEALIRSLYDKLREDFDLGEISAEQASELASMLETRTGISDPNPRGWDSSSWCYYGDDDGWNDSGCSF